MLAVVKYFCLFLQGQQEVAFSKSLQIIKQHKSNQNFNQSVKMTELVQQILFI